MRLSTKMHGKISLKTRVAAVLPTISRSGGGPTVSVRRLNEAINDDGRFESAVYAGTNWGSDDCVSDWREGDLRLFSRSGPACFAFSPGLFGGLMSSGAELVHLNGLWLYHAFAAYRLSVRRRIPLVVSPRGMLDPSALAGWSVHKWALSLLFQRKMLRRAACIIASSPLEADGLLKCGMRNICVIPNGIDIPPFRRRWAGGSVLPENRVALFLSRVHPQKGVSRLLRSWSAVRPKGWVLRLVGPSDVRYRELVLSEIKGLGLQNTVRLEGPLWGEAKARAYSGAELFILPSESESFGMAIGEAMAAGLPVIATRGAPWPQLEADRCGWWIECGQTSLDSALKDATGAAPQVLMEMGARGRNVILNRYTWKSVGERMGDIYLSLLGRVKGNKAQNIFL
jgi:glycosyltransferase involved in cell wall biosynthesis